MPEFVLPEFTRSLRALAVPSAKGGDHDLIFEPLLVARALAHKAQSFEAQLAAFDADRLERRWRSAISALASARHRSAADRRALEAELDLLAAPLWKALRQMAEAADTVKKARARERRSAWDQWVATVKGVFHAADDWWSEAQPRLGGAR